MLKNIIIHYSNKIKEQLFRLLKHSQSFKSTLIFAYINFDIKHLKHYF